MFQRKNLLKLYKKIKSAKALQTKEEDVEINTHKKRSISPEVRQQIIEELRLLPKRDVYIYKLLMN